jgi:hypothetical protein
VSREPALVQHLQRVSPERGGNAFEEVRGIRRLVARSLRSGFSRDAVASSSASAPEPKDRAQRATLLARACTDVWTVWVGPRASSCQRTPMADRRARVRLGDVPQQVGERRVDRHGCGGKPRCRRGSPHLTGLVGLRSFRPSAAIALAVARVRLALALQVLDHLAVQRGHATQARSIVEEPGSPRPSVLPPRPRRGPHLVARSTGGVDARLAVEPHLGTCSHSDRKPFESLTACTPRRRSSRRLAPRQQRGGEVRSSGWRPGTRPARSSRARSLVPITSS